MTHEEDEDPIITIEPSIFYEVLSTVEKIAVIAKITEVINTYQCFKDDGNSIPKHFYKMIQAKSFAPKPAMSHRRQKNLSYVEKVRRETVALLNKISMSNQASISDKLLRYCDEANVQIMADMVLAKCYLQPCYSELYFSLFKKLKVLHGELMSQVLDNFAENVMASFDIDVQEMAKMDCEDYDQFCMFVARKQQLCQKHLVLAMLGRHSMVSYDSEAHLTKISYLLAETENHMEIDIMISVLQYIIKETREPLWINRVKEVYPDLSARCMNKTKFMMENIVGQKI